MIRQPGVLSLGRIMAIASLRASGARPANGVSTQIAGPAPKKSPPPSWGRVRVGRSHPAGESDLACVPGA